MISVFFSVIHMNERGEETIVLTETRGTGRNKESMTITVTVTLTATDHSRHVFKAVVIVLVARWAAKH